MKHLFLSTMLLISNFCYTQAQQTCEVKLKDIAGTYEGDCENGKAQGNGTSTGTDTYKGEFKNGYPDGSGMYTWKDGHYFIGLFKKGNKEGKGTMYYEAASGADSVIAGYWKKDKYVGEYEKQFIVISTTNRISKVECRLSDKSRDNIIITVHQLANSGSLNSSGFIPSVTSINKLAGDYYSMNTQVLSNSSITTIQQVTFPFRVNIILNNGEAVDILFNEKGLYDVYLDM